ncbi:hypothetical protein GCM10011487_47230 [Steroidobacter agaridevorans]|uniref:DUF1622 domain-containing protein n=2 Tax=Steroidobacter agaridevorans TaxID=2695856 RepID=A0A829YIM7_9GAMM|nr:hypothetical protein GCM10011487_47230 [Steroidobacter agaridevorans]
MNQWMLEATHLAVGVIDVIAVLIILFGTANAFVSMLRVMRTKPEGHERRLVWIAYARWLVAGLTFQLAADIIESTIVESWDAVGRLAAIAAIRTFLNYFLERDLAEVRERDAARAEAASIHH